MRYTAVFEFAEEPTIKRSDSWNGGKLITIQFSDAIKELELLRETVEAIAFGDGDAQEMAQQTLDLLN